MEKYLNQGVQAVIEENPRVGEILDEFGIACTTCTAGSCLLKDVVGIHNLPAEEEVELMYQIEKALYPERDVKKPELKVEKTTKKEITYSPPVQQLVDEHKLIKRLLAMLPDLLEKLDENPDKVWPWIATASEFSSNYADKYHHAKEEDILFKYSDENLEIIQVMYDEHVEGRNHVAAVREAAKSRDKEKAVTHLLAYRELLQEHIKKEDEILYPWIDRNLSTKEVGELFSKFAKANQNAVDLNPKKYETFVREVEEELGYA
ncbi:hemerythrin domain-containing protein [Natronospora cellulosivora (SeqCode)]